MRGNSHLIICRYGSPLDGIRSIAFLAKGLACCRFRNLDSCVSMVYPAEDRIRNNVSKSLDRTCGGRVLPKRDVSSHLIIISRISRKNSSKVLCVEYHQMVKTFVSDRPDQALNISVLPGRAERGGPIPDAHRSHASLECGAKCSVIVANEIFRCAGPRKRLGDLARKPLCRWVSGHRNPQELPPSMAENKKREQLLKGNRRNHKRSIDAIPSI